MCLKRLFLFLLVSLSFVFAESDDLLSLDKMKPQTVIEKLKSVPVAYYGSLANMQFYSEEKMLSMRMEQTHPQLYKSFIDWKNAKVKRQEAFLSEAPEIYRKTLDLRNSSMNNNGFYLIEFVVAVDKVYDKETATWLTPKPGETKKSIYTFAYAGTDISKDSLDWRLLQRLIVIPSWRDLWQQESLKKRVFFLDGFSETTGFLDDYALEKILYYPYRLRYDLQPIDAIDVRERLKSFVIDGDYDAANMLADSANLSGRSKVLLKILNRDYDFVKNVDSTGRYLDDFNKYDYNDGLDALLNDSALYKYIDGSYCASLKSLSKSDSADVCGIVKTVVLKKSRERWIENKSNPNHEKLQFVGYWGMGYPFLVGKFPDFNSDGYSELGFQVYTNKFVFGFDVGMMSFDALCDSCGTGDYGIHVLFGYSWLKTRYIEGAVFVNLGMSALEVPPKRENPKGEYLHESYFRYGLGAYFDFLTPDLMKDPSKQWFESRLGLRLRFGFNNMYVSDIGRAKGIVPYIALGLTWHAALK